MPTCVAVLLCTGLVTSSPGQSIFFTTLLSFDGTNGAEGQLLTQGIDSKLYGTTLFGGTGSSCPYGSMGCGTVFQMTAGGALTTLYSFCQQPNCTDGYLPSSGLLQGQDGKFYGTSAGGAYINNFFPSGAIFRVSPAGAFSVFYSFCQFGPPCFDGAGPNGGLVLGSDGDFYGTTGAGGGDMAGNVYKITPAGRLTDLHDFQRNTSGGSYPAAGLVLATDGNFYGTTTAGGNYGFPCFSTGCGTVFRMSPSGTVTTLYSFCSAPQCADGAGPATALVQGSDGNLYGTTGYGTNLGSCQEEGCGNGTVFKIALDGTLTTLYRFCSLPNCTDGEDSAAALVQGRDGNFYSTTGGGGVFGNYGTVFKITPSGTLTTLHSFSHADGEGPSGLTRVSFGFFYGTTASGGAYNLGTVFRLGLPCSSVMCN